MKVRCFVLKGKACDAAPQDLFWSHNSSTVLVWKKVHQYLSPFILSMFMKHALVVLHLHFKYRPIPWQPCCYSVIINSGWQTVHSSFIPRSSLQSSSQTRAVYIVQSNSSYYLEEKKNGYDFYWGWNVVETWKFGHWAGILKWDNF